MHIYLFLEEEIPQNINEKYKQWNKNTEGNSDNGVRMNDKEKRERATVVTLRMHPG